MEASIGAALASKSTMFRDMKLALLEHLALLAEHQDMDAKQVARAFDKFMATKRQGKHAVELGDVEAFGREYALSAVKAQLPTAGRTLNTVYSRVISLDDVAIPNSKGGEGTGTPGSAIQQPPSQRITPLFKAKLQATAAKPLTPASSGKFAERSQPGTVQAVLNQHIEAPEPPAAEPMEVDGGAGASGRPRCEVRELGWPLPRGTRYMADGIEERIAYCERRIVAMAAEAEAPEGASAAEEEEAAGVHPVGLAAQAPTVFAGRIVCEAEDEKPTVHTLLLEGSRQHSEGARVKLDVSSCLAGCRLFRGQVVLVKGTNPSGHCIVASEIVPGVPLPMKRSSLQELAGHAAACGERGLSVVVAAGPYTVSDDLAYEPLAALLDYCSQHQPDALLLAGPFVNVEHPSIRDGQLEVLFEDLYREQVVAQLQRFSSSPAGRRTRVLLLPAVGDAFHHPVFPTPPLDEVPGQEGSILPVANPSTLQLNEVVLGCSTADWLRSVSSLELAGGASMQGDRMAALASHLITQRSYFPMFPAPEGSCLDTSKLTALGMPCTPDILVTPSQLAPFARLVPVTRGGVRGPAVPEGNVVCINPGRLVKTNSGGTFAHVYIAPHKEAAAVAAGGPASTNALMLHRVDERCRVEIKRI